MNKIKKWTTSFCPNCGNNCRIINGRWLKAIRLNAKLTQRQFGKKLKVSSPYISDIERNRRNCPDYILEIYLSLDKK